MAFKRTFPDDWSKLSIQEISDNVQYLCNHHNKYKIVMSDRNNMQIGNVRFQRVKSHGEYGFVINNKRIIWSAPLSNLYNYISELFDNVQREQIRKEKAAQWWENNGKGLITTVIGAAVVAGLLTYGKYLMDQKQNKDEQKQQEKEQMLQEKIRKSLNKKEKEQIEVGKTFYINNMFKQHIR